MSIIAPAGQQQAPAPGSSTESGTPPAAGSQQTPPVADWRTSLPDDLRSHTALASYKDIASLAKSHIHAQSLVGADKVVLPGKDATPEQRNEFYKKLGRPDAPTEYGLKLPEGLKEEGLSKERVDAWRGRLHELGLSKQQGEALLEAYLGEEHGAATAAAKAREEKLAADERAVRTEFGDKYDENINFVRLALNQFGNDALYEAIDAGGLGNNPAFVKAFADIGRSLAGEGTPRGHGAGNGGVVGTPEAAQAALTELHSNPTTRAALFDRAHAQHEEVVKRRAELFKIAHPAQ